MTTALPVSQQELRWKCRRGMLELDLLLNRFVDACYAKLSEQQLQTLLQLLDYPDQVLHDLLVTRSPSSDAAISQLIDEVLQYNASLHVPS